MEAGPSGTMLCPDGELTVASIPGVMHAGACLILELRVYSWCCSLSLMQPSFFDAVCHMRALLAWGFMRHMRSSNLALTGLMGGQCSRSRLVRHTDTVLQGCFFCKVWLATWAAFYQLHSSQQDREV